MNILDTMEDKTQLELEVIDIETREWDDSKALNPSSIEENFTNGL